VFDNEYAGKRAAFKLKSKQVPKNETKYDLSIFEKP